MNRLRRRGDLWGSLVLVVISLGGHSGFAGLRYPHEQAEDRAPVSISGDVIETARDTLENWWPEFLQLTWQVAGISLLLYVGSPHDAREVS
jgi:hypothetical protein